MSFDLPRPDEPAVRQALAQVWPDLADEPIAPLGNGWAFWAYRAGHVVLRFPRDPEFVGGLEAEAAVMQELAPTLSLPAAAIELHDNGPNDLPFTSHRLISGISVVDLPCMLSPDSGSVFGRFLRAMHRFPVERAEELGIPNVPPAGRKADLQAIENNVRLQVFPLVSEEARLHITGRFDAYLSDSANFDWRPVLSHGDLDDWNVLADPSSGELSGVIDWGDISIGDPARDFTTLLYGGFAAKGMHLRDVLLAYGISEGDLETIRPRCAFSAFRWPLHEILYGLDSRQDNVVRGGIELLYRTISAPPA